MKHKIIFFGTPDVAAQTLLALLELEYEVLLVVSLPDKAQGRKMQVQPSPVTKVALQKGIDVFQPKNVNEADSLNYLAKYNADLFLVVAYGKILNTDILNLPKLGCYNLHYSLLPKLRGAAPVQFSLLNGDELSGVSLIKMNKFMDKGPILAQKPFAIPQGINYLTLQSKLCLLGIELLLEVLPDIQNIKPINQDDTKATYTKLIDKKKDALINWQNNYLDIYRRWQAFSPKPGLYTFCEGVRVILSVIKVMDKDDSKRKTSTSNGLRKRRKEIRKTRPRDREKTKPRKSSTSRRMRII